MFNSRGPFKSVECPEGTLCKLLHCIFTHEENGNPPALEASYNVSSIRDGDDESGKICEPPLKRQRLLVKPQASTQSSVIANKNSPVDESLERESRRSRKNQSSENDRNRASPVGSHRKGFLQGQPVLRTQKKEVSPPLRKQSTGIDDGISSSPSVMVPFKRKRQEVKQESLVPRPVPRPPASHGVRLKLLTLIHEQLIRLNAEVNESSDDWKDALALSQQELVKEALDEEERIATANAAVYTNVIKLRITAFRKMKFDAWKAERIKQIEKEYPELKKPSPAIRVETGLTEAEEISMLSTLVAVQDGLAKHGYITSEISAPQIEEARKGVETARGYEQCDRCGSRFQVFPGRREDGLLTTGGECVYHSGKMRRPPREPGNPSQAERYTCCQSEPGSKGCQQAKHHVFKVSEAKRLALVLPFKSTPHSGDKGPAKTKAVCFDCEMGYTTMGMELIRLTATAWPSELEILDVLVRPIGEILDLNSKFSGVWPHHFTNAMPFDRVGADGQSSDSLCIVESPGVARDLLFEHLTPATPLIGHALENDLNAVRIIHPTIIDTVLLYPHPRGLPIRHGLKALVKKHLNKDIQMAGAQGHDSKEDARAAGELVRLRVAEKWKEMLEEGWTTANGVFNPPPPK